MDTLFAPIYDTKWGSYINPTHQRMLEQLLTACPANALILDAACGTGKYWPLILSTGRQLVGIDQSQQMLNVAQAKHPAVPVRKLGLQELDDHQCYDGIICIDAMENVFPEDWLQVLHNFHCALQKGGWLYLTVEVEAPEMLETMFQQARQQGLPVVEGELVHDGAYHYYPTLPQMHRWLEQARFAVVQTAEGDGYYHVLTRGC
jgi:SAM-dependent methyltransferase